MDFSTTAGGSLTPNKSCEAGALADQNAQDRDSAQDDQSLIQRVAAKDIIALTILYDRYAGMVYSVVRGIITDQGAAEEIIPGIFCRLWSQASGYRPGRGTVAEFLLALTRKCAMNRLLSRESEPGERLQTNLTSIPLDPEAQITDQFLMASVKKILAELPHSQPVSVERLNLDPVLTGKSERSVGWLLETIKTKVLSVLRALRQLSGEDFQSSKQKEPRNS